MHVLPENIFKKYLQCELCQGNFKEPKLLPCKHTFCQRCLERHLRRSTTTTASLWFLCPSCRNITDVPAEGIASFKSNYFVVNLSSALESNCSKDISKYKLSDHAVIQSEIHKNCLNCKAEEKQSRNEDDLCICKGNAVRIYCEECRSVLCGECFHKNHENHTFMLLEDRANKDRDIILSTVSDGKADVNKIQEGLDDLTRYKRNLRHTRDEAAAKIKKQATKMRELITQMEEQQIKEIDEVYNRETEKATVISKHNTDVCTMLRTLNEFSQMLLEDGKDSQIVMWKNTISKQHQTIRCDAKIKAVEFLKDNPLDMSYIVINDDLQTMLKKLLGKIEFGKSIDLFDEGLGLTSCNYNGPTEFISDGTERGSVRLLTNRIHEASLVKSFSIFTDGSQYSPQAADIAVTPNDSIVAVDRNNKTVKIFGPDGGLQRKIYGSECLWGVCLLDKDTIAVTDNTVHIFDMKGRLVKVLRQQPRDSHGIACLSNGHVVVTDCSSRCVYVLSTVGGTIQRIITQRGRQPFRCPQYVCVSHDDNIIISDTAAHTITVLTDRGRFVGEFGVSGNTSNDNSHLNTPSGVATDRLDNILVCDKLNNRLLLLDSQARYLCTLVEGKDNLNHPQAITVDSNGNAVIIEECGKVKIYKYREKNILNTG